MAVNRTQYIAEKRSLLQLAGLRHGEQTCQGDFALGAAVAIRDLANEHEQAHGALADIVGWLHSLVFDERKQLVPMQVECACQIAHLAVVAVQVFPVSYTHLRAHETRHDLVCRLLLEKKKQK